MANDKARRATLVSDMLAVTAIECRRMGVDLNDPQKWQACKVAVGGPLFRLQQQRLEAIYQAERQTELDDRSGAAAFVIGAALLSQPQPTRIPSFTCDRMPGGRSIDCTPY